MNNHKYDIAIAYRVYPGLAKNVLMAGSWRNKLHFSEVCLKSLVRGLDGVKYRMFALLDGCDSGYEDIFRSNCKDVEIIKYRPLIGNRGTFSAQMDILLKQADAEAIYFAEDDYFYKDGAISEMFDMLKREDVDFIAPYDHPDLYTRKDLHNYKSEIVFHGKRHWRTAASVCFTFLTKKQVFKETERPFRSFNKISDFAVWLAITKMKRYDAPYKTLKRMYKHNFLHILTARPFRLWSPMPSLATHMVATHTAPGTDWEKLIKMHL